MYEKYQIIQDMLVPMDQLESSLDVFHQELKVGTQNIIAKI